ncbi:MAG: RNA--NAD 2'-phosphotransferase [Candidatus Eisenbacteria bacterium]|nr:RNA--NAD 2'-phosphotransferase [Candidatus Latescibacterota bacterium]MBD3301987.1 RNA--NAD 2'-phosphotransferase [Candidatus Eisenbacteria bacterium]
MNAPPSRDLERLSRFLAMVLRHRPESAGITLDEEGWVSVERLVEALRRSWRKGPVNEAIIRRIVDLDAKGRYEIATAGGPPRIRAAYGHSVPLHPTYPRAMPPALLYHGTARRFLGRILATGLHPRGRRFVHLSVETETAREVGLRRDPTPVILVVDAATMVRDGHLFYLAAQGLYLTPAVPASRLRILEPVGED